MQINNYLKNRQPIIYKTFSNALNNKSLSHAYLLVGQKGTPLLETATYMAKSILCDEPTPFACDNCITCSRVDENNYPDFIVYNGETESIKKTQISDLESNFERKAFEQKGIKIYILHLIENMTVQAINALLKFLEEPGQQIYAFLTTNNESAILPTIISRCQVLHLKLTDRNEVINRAIELGVEKDDAQLLSYFYNDEHLLFEANEDNKDYLEAKEGLISFLTNLTEDKSSSLYTMQRKVSPLLNSKESLRFFIDLLLSIFEDAQLVKYGKQPILSSFEGFLHKIIENCPNLELIIIELLKAKSTINLNINTSLLLDHITLKIIGAEL